MRSSIASRELSRTSDEPAVAAVTQLYREVLPAGGAVLDLMRSWVNHLPPEVAYRRVVGLGMNQDELAANPRLDAYTVKDLNREPRSNSRMECDAATICVSIQYLVHPVDVIRELGRVVCSGGPLVITFSNRCLSRSTTPATRGSSSGTWMRPETGATFNPSSAAPSSASAIRCWRLLPAPAERVAVRLHRFSYSTSP
jgi:hypothetical protein